MNSIKGDIQLNRYINTEKAPAAIGPYSQAVSAGNMVYTSGQIAIDPETQEFRNGTVEEQTVRVLENLRAVLEAAGTSMDNAVKVTVFLSDMDNFSAVNEIYGKYFTEKPARSTVAVKTLPKNALVEIDCIASL